MAVLALVSDLMLQSQVSSATQRAGVPLTIASGGDDCAAKAETLQPQLVIVDLTHPGLDVATLGKRLAEVMPADSARLAFGPHVHKERLAAAEAAGFLVLSRGQFHANLNELIAQLKP